MDDACRLRLADLLVGLSRVADAGMGFEPGEAARTCLLAMRLAEAAGAPDLSTTYYTALLQHLGCTAYAHEAARRLGGDELAVKAAAVRTDFRAPREVLRGYLPALAPDAPLLGRLRAAGVAMTQGSRIAEGYRRANCEVAAMTAHRIGLPDAVADALLAIFEQPDGRGGPRGLRGGAIPLAARIAQVAAVGSLFAGLGGREAACEAVRRRSPDLLDADLAAVFTARAGELIDELESVDVARAAVAAEPPPVVGARGPLVDRACAAFGDLVDLKSPFLHGHAAGTAALAEAAGARLGLPDERVAALRRAGWLHDIGRCAIRNGIWEKPGALTVAETEQVRLHAYHGERVLAACPPLAELAAAVGMHHERLDGSGYHRGARGMAIPLEARVLAAADAFHAITQERPHRRARPPEAAAHELVAERDGGRLDADAVEAVLHAAGEQAPRARRDDGLTARQVEVLRLVAAGLSNPQIARRLVVSPRTAERHVQDIYARIGVSSRAAAALYAMQHGLLGVQDS